MNRDRNWPFELVFWTLVAVLLLGTVFETARWTRTGKAPNTILIVSGLVVVSLLVREKLRR